jgi:putative transposase
MTTEHSGQVPAGGSVVEISDDQLVAMLVDRARGTDLKPTGEGGLLQQPTKRVLESALEGEITDHVGFDRHDKAANSYLPVTGPVRSAPGSAIPGGR